VSAQIRTLIVDDEPAAREAIATLLGQDPDVVVVGECADGHAAIAAIQQETPDLVFLDIQMPELSGFDVLRAVSAAPLPFVVFVTAYDEHALRAFDVHALDYLLKPYTDERFRAALGHAKKEVRRGRLDAASRQLMALLEHVGLPDAASGPSHAQRLVIKTEGRVTIVNVADIDWIEADGDYVKIHAGRAWHQLRETMKRIEDQLDPRRFVRIHRSTIVNIERIKELQPLFRGEYVAMLEGGAKLKVSRGYKPHLEAALGRAF
jgi:two-component system LytT family response regulator